jgi:caffeoyl-CoA O-methyltransferase
MAAPLKTGAHHSSGGRGLYGSPKLLSFVTDLMAPEDRALRRIRENTVKDGLPPISIGPDEGKLLHFLVKACAARRAVEVGTLAGYSGAWIARALPADGSLRTFEYSPKHAEVARRNFKRAGVGSKVTVHVGAARETLPAIEGEGPFDFCFIDADKVSYPHYLRWAAANLRPGGIVVADNAYLFGKLHLAASKAGDDAPGVPAMRETLALMADEEIFASCAMVPTGEGMAVAVRR